MAPSANTIGPLTGHRMAPSSPSKITFNPIGKHYLLYPPTMYKKEKWEMMVSMVPTLTTTGFAMCPL